MENGVTVQSLPITFAKSKMLTIGIHYGSNSVNVIALYDYMDDLSNVGLKTFDTAGNYNATAAVNWISVGC